VSIGYTGTKGMQCKVYVYIKSVSSHEVYQVSGNVAKSTGSMIVDKISGIITGTTTQ